MSLTEKFKKLKVEATDRLDSVDREFCDRVTRMANEALEHQKNLYEKIQPIWEAEDLGYKINRADYIEKPSGMYDENFESVKTSVSSLVAELMKAYTATLYKFKRYIFQYFQNKYNIKIISTYDVMPLEKWRENLKGMDCYQPLDYSDLLEAITELTGGVNLKQLGTQNFISSVQDVFKSYQKKNYTIQGAKILISAGFTPDSDYRNINYPNSWRWTTLNDAFNFFETQDLHDLKMDRTMGEQAGEPCDMKELVFPYLEKTKGIKIYKNGRADIRFRDAGTAKEFEQLFGLQLIAE